VQKVYVLPIILDSLFAGAKIGLSAPQALFGMGLDSEATPESSMVMKISSLELDCCGLPERWIGIGSMCNGPGLAHNKRDK
jgi:hypothetical protein